MAKEATEKTLSCWINKESFCDKEVKSKCKVKYITEGMINNLTLSETTVVLFSSTQSLRDYFNFFTFPDDLLAY